MIIATEYREALVRHVRDLQRLATIEPTADSLSTVEVAVRQIETLAQRMSEAATSAALADPGSAVDYLVFHLGDVPGRDLARVLGVSPRTLASWRRGGSIGSRNAPRVVLVARLVQVLRCSWTQRGITAWFGARHDAIHCTPLDLMDRDVAAARAVLPTLARGVRP